MDADDSADPSASGATNSRMSLAPTLIASRTCPLSFRRSLAGDYCIVAVDDWAADRPSDLALLRRRAPNAVRFTVDEAEMKRVTV
jgi:hypothetical protein